MKRRKRTKRGQAGNSPPSKKVKKSVRTKRGYVWVRGPIGKSGRRKPGHWRKKPATTSKAERKPPKPHPDATWVKSYKRGKKVVSGYWRVPKHQPKEDLTPVPKSVGEEIREKFIGTETSNDWVQYFPVAQTYHEKYTIDPSKTSVAEFSKKYGEMPQHMVVEYVDENGEVQHASTALVASDESELTLKKMDELLSQYSKGGKIQEVRGFSLWVHDKLEKWQAKGLA